MRFKIDMTTQGSQQIQVHPQVKRRTPVPQLSIGAILCIAFLLAPMSHAGLFPIPVILQDGVQGADPLFAFTDSGPTFLVSVTLNANSNGNGTFTATSGSGFFNSDPIVLIPGSGISPSGAFIYDSVLYPAANPKLDIDGLLFRDTVTGAELNIWGNANGTYSTYLGFGPGNYPLQYNSPAGITLGQVPEPGTWFLMLAGLSVLLFLRAGRRRVAEKAGTGLRELRL
ncbi:MAG TPA: PEP-CTERM sorting domain-containing protein [Bryobacteraceae bacterium]|nr:PEP-CTERM sorting domain-containing protein [Bryobacteraceae bacterium]